MSVKHKGRAAAIAAALMLAPAAASADAVQDLERQLRQMQQQMQQMQQELARMKAEQQKVRSAHQEIEAGRTPPMQELERRVTRVESAAALEPKYGNRVTFRGGYADALDDRSGEIFTDTNLQAFAGLPSLGANDGWYASAGLEFLMSDDLLGLMPGTWLSGELTIEFKDYGSQRSVLITPTAECLLATATTGATAVANCAVMGDNHVTMLSLSAAPKIRFLEGSKIRPWIIPVGFDVNVISPPSDAATVLELGAVFGGGVDYELLPNIFLGLDARYHYVPGFTNTDNNFAATVNNVLGANAIVNDTDKDRDFWTVGASLSIGF
ncbi:MAG: hypothetical protein Q9Q40_13610 [Acidobacteriota bacterium]|nr:hypothetical protein [Acidobacteriota bacterium]